MKISSDLISTVYKLLLFERIKSGCEASRVTYFYKLLLQEPQIKNDIFILHAADDENTEKEVKKLMKKEAKKLSIMTLSDIKGKQETWQFDVHTNMLSSAK